jgi:cytidylate kinase
MKINHNYEKVIAIDGPSGSGKSTIAKELAKSLNVLYIDTGAMFRALAFACDQAKIAFIESEELKNFLNNINLEYGINEKILIQIDGIDLTEKIREHHVSRLASIISQLPSVRNFLLNFQRKLASDRVCVMEGRDIGTVVFPNSFSKFFITASDEIRAKRRLKQLQDNGENNISLEQVIVDVKKRDETDSNRTVAPLKKAEDALLLDNSNLALIDVIQVLSKEVKFRASHLGFNL